jgi:hypothetical protein
MHWNARQDEGQGFGRGGQVFFFWCSESLSLHRSQISQEFVINSGSGSRMARLRQTILLLFLKENFKTHCFRIPSLKKSLNWRGGACLRTF